ncbi:MAG: TonB-dependent receptor [Saprospiraceae bacterium]|nr:MAG: TonB-dependent receptor [Saprospiraceae bacterium]
MLQVSDSALIKGQVTLEDGTYLLENLNPGNYAIEINMLGFKAYRTDTFVLTSQTGEKNMGATTMKEDVTELDAVEVVAKKPLFEQKADRLVVNVANTITSAGSTALEVLERSPGVMVNRQNNSISISGKSGVVVMINGRINYMSAEAVVQLLAGISSENIEKIELITTPPANFDAEGNAGFINIVLKKNLDDGFSGSYSLSAGYGKGEVGNASLNFNYRQGKFNLYGDYSHLRNAQDQVFIFQRSVKVDNELIETNTHSDREPLQVNHNGRLGLDVQVSEKTVVGALFSIYDTKWTMDAFNTAMISTNQVPQSQIEIQNVELNQWRHYGGNLNLQHTFNEGETLNFDVDYLYYRDNNPTNYLNAYFDGNDNFDYAENTRSGKLTPIKIGVGKLDYGRQMGEKVKMSTGLKGTISSFTNDVSVEKLVGQIWESDPELTNKYELHENILAAFADLDISLDKKTSVKVGLRYEYTDSQLDAIENERIVDRQYGRLFPSLFISRKINEKKSVNFSYSRRITRPTFNDMAPFVIFVDPTTFFSGNPALQPAFSNTFKLDYQLKSALFSLQYSKEDSTIARFQSRVIPGTNQQLIFAQNMKYNKTASLTVSLPFSPAKWWNMYINASGIWQEAGIYIEDLLDIVDLKSLNVFSSQTFTLPENFTFELTGFYNSGSLFGSFVVKPFGAVNAGLQKKFKRNGSTLRLGFDNIFNTLSFNMSSEVPALEQSFIGELQFAQPTIKLTYSHNFGNRKMKGQRKRATGSEEERQRVN